MTVSDEAMSAWKMSVAANSTRADGIRGRLPVTARAYPVDAGDGLMAGSQLAREGQPRVEQRDDAVARAVLAGTGLRPISEIRCRELTAPKRPFACAPRPPKVPVDI